MTGIPARVRWAVDHIAAPPDAHVLEVGAGPGASAELLCPRLPDGRLTVVDRSAVAVRRTTARNAVHVEAGRLVVIEAALAGLALPHACVDIAFSVDVNVFWVSSGGPELEVLREALRPGGTLHLVYGGNGPTAPDRVVGALRTGLRRSGFEDPVLSQGEEAFAVTARTPAVEG